MYVGSSTQLNEVVVATLFLENISEREHSPRQVH